MNTAVDLTLFFILSSVGITYWLAQAFSYSGGVINSYLLNRQWTFQVAEKKSRREFSRFLLVNLITLILTASLLKMGLQLAEWSLVTSKIAATGGGMLVNYGLTKSWVFVGGRESYDLENSEKNSGTP